MQLCVTDMLRALQRATSTTGRCAQQRRAFFGFTKHDESETQRYREQKIFPYRRNELYNVITDVGSYPNFLPYCTGSRVLESKAGQSGTIVMQAELTVGFLAFKESYISHVTCTPHESVEILASSSPLFKSLATVWRLHPVSSSSQLSTPFSPEVLPRSPASQTFNDQVPTLVTLDLAFAFASPTHAAVSATFFGQVSKLMVKAFEQRCVVLYGPRAD